MSKQDYSLDELLASPSFERWVYGEASERERKFWDQWIMDNPENRKLAKKAQEKIVGVAFRPVTNPSAERIWESIQLHLKEENEREEYHSLRKRFKKNNRLNWVVRIAAGFLLIAFSGFLITYFFQSPAEEATAAFEEEVITDFGVQKTLRFSDGSEIILNGHSRMVYASDKESSSSVDLFLEGEAYFSIPRRDNPGSAPFLVRTEGGIVKVLGTRFVVSTYNNQTQVIVESGSVAVNPFGAEVETVLEQGQLGTFTQTSQLVQTEFVNPEVYTSWTTGRLYFDNTPMQNVAKRLENTHGVKVVFRDSSIHEQRISGSIESSTLEIIMSALSKMLNTSIYKSESENVIYIGDSME